jgi:hypothetical protein
VATARSATSLSLFMQLSPDTRVSFIQHVHGGKFCFTAALKNIFDMDRKEKKYDTRVVPEQKQSLHGSTRMLGGDARSDKPVDPGFSYDWSSLSFTEREESSISMKCTFRCSFLHSSKCVHMMMLVDLLR